MLIKILPYFQEKIWGSQRLKEFNFKFDSKLKIGEAWVVSGYNSKSSFVPFFNLNLDQLWIKNPNFIFGKIKKYQEFPLLIKFLDANDDLSIQVHPDDKIINQKLIFGKPECWYVLKPPINQKLIYGHNALNKTEFLNLTKQKQWKKLFKYVSVKENDFLYVPPGKVHALTTKAMVLEIQKSCDITYRIYDYDRLGLNQKKRPLHLKQALETIQFPDSNNKIINLKNNLLLKTNFFTIHVFNTFENKKEILFPIVNNWAIIVILEGKGFINDNFVIKGESYILSYQKTQNLKINPNLKVIISNLTN